MVIFLGILACGILGYLSGNADSISFGKFISFSVLALLSVCGFSYLKRSIRCGLLFGICFYAGFYLGASQFFDTSGVIPTPRYFVHYIMCNLFGECYGYQHSDSDVAILSTGLGVIASIIGASSGLIGRLLKPASVNRETSASEQYMTDPQTNAYLVTRSKTRHERTREEAIPHIELGEVLDTPLSGFEARADVVCPVCRAGFTSGQRARICPACEVRHHKECWDMIGGCSTFGCKYASTS